MWHDIDDVIIKTLISAHSVLKHNYRTCFPNHVRGSACFEILGFDVMVDKKLKPFLLEVSFYSETRPLRRTLVCKFTFKYKLISGLVFKKKKSGIQIPIFNL